MGGANQSCRSLGQSFFLFHHLLSGCIPLWKLIGAGGGGLSHGQEVKGLRVSETSDFIENVFGERSASAVCQSQ